MCGLRLCGCVAVAAAFAVPSAGAAVVLNEIQYDPVGPDSGHEYVELLNTGDVDVVLDARWVLERGNGARPDDWVGVWSGDGTVLVPGARLVIGDDPRAHRPAALGLQNGPDACRLAGPDGVVDLVGWGEHVHPGYAEGSPAPDPDPGLLVRRPDGIDTGDNAADLVPGDHETPGEPNFLRRLLSFVVGVPQLDPPLPEPGERFRLVVSLRSLGMEAIDAGRAGLMEEDLGVRLTLDRMLLPGGVRADSMAFPGRAAGAHELRVRTFGDSLSAIVAEAVPCRIGSGPVVLSEIVARPADGGPEWVELVTRQGGSVSLSGWRLVDATGTAARLDGDVVAGAPLVVTSDPATMLERHPDLAPGSVVEAPGWPTLNDSGETLHLIGPDDRVSDSVTFTAAPVGASLERVNVALPSRDPAAWVISPGQPTPGRLNGAHAEPPRAPGFTVEPPVVGPAGAEVRFHLGEDTGELRLVVIDAAGRERGVILERGAASGRGGIHWDGRVAGARLPVGLYVLVATLRRADGSLETRRAPVAIPWEDE